MFNNIEETFNLLGIRLWMNKKYYTLIECIIFCSPQRMEECRREKIVVKIRKTLFIITVFRATVSHTRTSV